jgi:hypothetical protein
MRVSLDIAPQIIASCAILHNIARRFNLPDCSDGMHDENEEDFEQNMQIVQDETGLNFRKRFANENFS